MLHFPLNYFFLQRRDKERGYKPLQPLGFMQIAVTYQMLHWCNILTGIFLNILYLIQQNNYHSLTQSLT